MSEHHEEKTPHREGITRRTIVAGAAWSVPVVAMAAAAPLAAASTSQYDLIISGFQAAPASGGNVTPSQAFNTVGTITNIGTGPVTGLVLQMTFPYQVADNFTTPSGWVLTSKTETTGTPKRWVLMFTYSGTLAAGESIDFRVGAVTRVPSQFPQQSQSFAIVSRIWANDGTPMSDEARTQITVNK